MNEAVFISDLHLHPQQPDIFLKFQTFVAWAETHTKAVYILGDFFHVWPGDDAIDDWSNRIIALLLRLHERGVRVYYMAGNRDFLLSSVFLHQSKVNYLNDPTVVTLGNQSVLLAHGDRYCTKDRSHQWFRKLTRNRYFKTCFLRLPYRFRAKLVNQVRQHSQENKRKPEESMQIVVKHMLSEMQHRKTMTIIHGHIHHPGLTLYEQGAMTVRQFVLSDWDENPVVLCYNGSQYVFYDFLSGASLNDH